MNKEKTQQLTITMLPSIKKKAAKLSKKLFGKANLSKLIAYLIIEEAKK